MGVEVVGEAVTAGGAGLMGGAGGTLWGGGVGVTLLSRVVMHLADSQSVALVRDSGEGEYFPPVDFLLTERMLISGIATLATMGISVIGTIGIIAISSTILISWRSVFLIGGTQTAETSTTDIPTRMRITIRRR